MNIGLNYCFKADYVKEVEVMHLINTCKESERILIETLKTAKKNKE